MTLLDDAAAGAPTALDRSVSSKVSCYAVLVVLLIGVALAAHQPQLVGLAAPFGVALVLGLLLARRPRLAVGVAVEADRVVEGDEVTLTVTLRADVDVARAELAVPLPPGLTWTREREDDGLPASPRAVGLRAGRPRTLALPVQVTRWGVHELGALAVRVRGPLGLATYEATWPTSITLRAFPRVEELRQLARPADTTLAVGSSLARAKADGFEYADIRAFVPGDRVRNVNWRATARRGELRVNDRHPERSTDVVLLVDAFDNLALPAGVRGAVSLASAYLAERDRVGVVSFGGVLRWLRLGLGDRQLYRIVDALIESAATYSYAWKALDLLPAPALPPHALLVALSPLTDRRTVVALLDRAARGTPVAVVHVSLEPLAPPGPRPTQRLGHAMWRLETARVADRLRDRGVPVVSWREGEPLAAAVEEVATFQRFARHAIG